MEELSKYFLSPSSLVVLFSISGVILPFRSISRRFGRTLLLAAACIYVFFSTGPVSFWLLGNLEYQFPYITDFDSIVETEYVVVLAGYAERDSLVPLSSRVNRASAFRLLETIRIVNELPRSSIIITGCNDVPEIMKEVLVAAGIPEGKILVDKRSASTSDSARNVSELIKGNSFVLVTSAGHMPRSMQVFMKLGMFPVPAPTDYRSRKNYLAIDYWPSPLHLEYSDLAVHEYAAILWYRLRDRI